MVSPTQFTLRQKELGRRMKAARMANDIEEMQRVLQLMTRLLEQNFGKRSDQPDAIGLKTKGR